MTDTIKVVINTRFGGFSLTEEIREWLIKNRGWNPMFFSGSGNYVYHNAMIDGIFFRENTDLIDCVEALQELHKDDNYSIKQKNQLWALKVITIKHEVSVENSYDGKEKVNFGWWEE